MLETGAMRTVRLREGHCRRPCDVGWRLLQSDWRAGPAWVTATRDPRDRVAAMGRRGEGGVDGDLGSPFTPTGRNCDREGKPGGNLETFV